MIEDVLWLLLGLVGLVLVMLMFVDLVVVLLIIVVLVLVSDDSVLFVVGFVMNLILFVVVLVVVIVVLVVVDGKLVVISLEDVIVLLLLEMILFGKCSECGEGSDVVVVGDCVGILLLYVLVVVVVQDFKVVFVIGNVIFNGEFMFKFVLGDDGFDQVIGVWLGWLVDQKIGYVYICLSLDDMGLVDVCLQLNGDKVYVSFSSLYVDVW